MRAQEDLLFLVTRGLHAGDGRSVGFGALVARRAGGGGALSLGLVGSHVG